MSVIRQIATRDVFRSRWMRLREDDVVFPDGTPGRYGVVDKDDFAVVVPVHDDGLLQLVRQYRYPVQGRYWEVPQGSWEGRANVDPAELANGELEEETGWRAEELQCIGRYQQAPGYSSRCYTLFLAEGLIPGKINRDDTEQGMETQAFTLNDVLQMIETGEIADGTTIAALELLRLKEML